MSKKRTHAETILPIEAMNTIQQYNDQLAVADAEAGAEYPTRINWSELAQAATRLARDEKTANGWIAGGAIRRVIEDMEDRLPAHIEPRILTAFVEDVVKALQTNAAVRQPS